MIEKYIKNEQQLKQWRRFKARKLAVISSWLLLFFSFFSLTAEFWANSKPIFLQYEGKIYLPFIEDMHPTEFGVDDILIMDYRSFDFAGKGAKVVWPIVKWDPFESNKKVDTYPSPPTKENWLGTDDRGRDVFARLLYGYRYSMAYAAMVFVFTSILAVILGGTMGYFGGWVDILGQRMVEIVNSLPFLFILIIIASIFQPNLIWLVIITSALGWVFMSYYIRGEFLKNRKKEFVEAAKALGAGHRRVIFKHILPNSLGPLITYAPFIISTYIISLASLDYLGFGLQPPTPSWGELLNQAQKYFSIAFWLAVFPSLALFLTLVLLSLVGEGIRGALKER